MTKLWVAVLLLALGSSAGAFPTSSNLLPTADMLELGTLRVEIENDGAPHLFDGAAESFLLLQYAPTPRLEVGLDLYSVGSENSVLLNAKWQLAREQKRRPAIAAGIFEIGATYSPTGYLVGTKDVGGGRRLHAGAAARGDERAFLLGAEIQIGGKDYLLADWASWPGGYLSFGIYRELTEDLALNLAYAWPNDRDEPGLTVLNISRTFEFR